MRIQRSRVERGAAYKYYAFISYNQHDLKWGKRLQRKLEGYKIPSTMCSERGLKRTPIKPVFFAPTDIQPGPLTDELKNRLEQSKNLIVICSPNSAKSEWVGQEISYFHSLGRVANIHFFIVDGVPNSGMPETDCFHPVIKDLKMDGNLGANINEQNYRWPWLNKERAYVQLVSKLLSVEFDSIWKRHKRLLIQKLISWTMGITAVLAILLIVWQANQPIDVAVNIESVSVDNKNLPECSDVVVAMTIGKEIKTDTVKNISGKALFRNVPHKYIGKNIRVSLKAKNHLSLDTIVTLEKTITLPVRRNPDVYGRVEFILWNETAGAVAEGITCKIGNYTGTSDKDGRVVIVIPLEEQQTQYKVESAVTFDNDTIYMPCYESTYLLIK